MDQRRESRIKLNKAVTLTIVNLMGQASAGNPMMARVLDVSGSGIRLDMPLPVPCGAEVVIEDQRTRILGETVRCDPKSEGYIVAVRVSETTLLHL